MTFWFRVMSDTDITVLSSMSSLWTACINPVEPISQANGRFLSIWANKKSSVGIGASAYQVCQRVWSQFGWSSIDLWKLGPDFSIYIYMYPFYIPFNPILSHIKLQDCIPVFSFIFKPLLHQFQLFSPTDPKDSWFPGVMIPITWHDGLWMRPTFSEAHRKFRLWHLVAFFGWFFCPKKQQAYI